MWFNLREGKITEEEWRAFCDELFQQELERNKDVGMEERKYTVWRFGDSITTQISAAEVEELKITARAGYQTIDTFFTDVGVTQIVSSDWVIAIEEK
tara:strand:+ start:257 stop:547 length:291 start_codon:yes stop_codon:yes gene_type:complete